MFELGKLKKEENLRSVWGHEALDFTKWLAEEENLELLGNELGIDMEVIGTEVRTGSYFADILALDSNTGEKIVIENQLEETDHSHLGQIITYASGHDAKTIIWLVRKVREEHRRAVDWLNDHTDDEINIFLCEIELWKIDDSKLAPNFQIVSSPNNWTKIIKRSTVGELSATKMLQLNYWTQLSEMIDKNEKYYSTFRSRKPSAQNWYSLALGSGKAHIVLSTNTLKNEISSNILIKNHKDLFEYLYSQKEEIEEEFGCPLIWKNEENKVESTIFIIRDMDLSDEDIWEESIKWHLDMAVKLYNVFSKRISEIK